MFPNLEFIKTVLNGVLNRIEKVETKLANGTSQIHLDTTLKEAGKAADAAAVGERLSSLSEEIAAIPSGKDGITPTIGENGNWYLGDTDTGKPSRGETGPAGADGKDGAPGAAGADGYTPVKGTDYWTQDDQNAIVADVLAALPTWEGGSY